ncbi:MAG: beta-propeller fold lactonase family protein, partial [Chloracidobacterium sp.]
SLVACLSLMLLALLFAGGPIAADRVAQPQPEFRLTPAGTLIRDAKTHQPAVGALPVKLVRSPDGRYLVVVNSGFGMQRNATHHLHQSLAVIDLAARPAPVVIQNVYVPAPQSVCVGAVFSPTRTEAGSYTLYVSGGNENKIWCFQFTPGAERPLTPAADDFNVPVEAPFLDVTTMATEPASPRYNNNFAPVFPLGLALDAAGDTLYSANNLGDSLGILHLNRDQPSLSSVKLQNPKRPTQATYPYEVVVVSTAQGEKVYVSCWGDGSLAVVNPGRQAVKFIELARHPTAMALDRAQTRLYVVNSDGDAVSVIDTSRDVEIERIALRLDERQRGGASPQSLALDETESVLYVANARANCIAVVALGEQARPAGATNGAQRSTAPTSRQPSNRQPSKQRQRSKETEREAESAEKPQMSRVRGFIPTGLYPSAVAVVGNLLIVGNGKGTGFENSSVVATSSGRFPNAPNDRFPVGTGQHQQGGQYSVALVGGTLSRITLPDDRQLADYTRQTLQNIGLLGARRTRLFSGASPIKHIIYVIKENRTYDSVFGDLEKAGDGTPADGDPYLALFGAGDAAVARDGTAQIVTPNHRALALRFGLFDRFFVNSEASPDGHNWATAALSSDYTDKAFRWEYSRRSRTYDYEGFNRLPNFAPRAGVPPAFDLPATAEDIERFLDRFIPYRQGARDVAEPETLYLWDAVARAGLTYRNYGEFVGTVSQAELDAINANRRRTYPDLTPNVTATPTKKALEGKVCPTFRNFDMHTPDAMTTDSYLAAVQSAGAVDAVISLQHPDGRFRGTSRLGAWLDEFNQYVEARKATGRDALPNLSMVRLSNDHTSGMTPGLPTPQFHVADNDYALGRLVEAVSTSPYWKDTAIFVVEDDAQNGPDHVDCHRSVALVISAYNRPGRLIHEYHTTVSLIRTMELLLGLPPMNALDANAVPMAIFQDQPDLRPYRALLPTVAASNLLVGPPKTAQEAAMVRWCRAMNLAHADLEDADELNDIIWYAACGDRRPGPGPSPHLPVFAALAQGVAERDD